MALIIIGTGLLKPNVSSVVGDLYTKEDERRDSGFSIFYMGINLGGLLAPLIVGTLGQKYNYHLGFGCAAAGMFLGLIVFALTRKKYLGKAGSNVPNPISKSSVIGTGIGVVIAATVIIVLIQTGWLTIQRVIDTVSILGIVIPVIYFIVMFTSKKRRKRKNHGLRLMFRCLLRRQCSGRFRSRARRFLLYMRISARDFPLRACILSLHGSSL